MTTELLQTFLALCRIRSFRRTADELFITQSTVTFRILSLEEELGAQLFLRSHTGLALTAAGEAFLPYAKKMLELQETAEQSIHFATAHMNLVRIGSTETVFDAYLMPRLAQFSKQHPSFRFSFTIGESVDLFRICQEGMLDILYTSRSFRKKGYLCKKLFSEPFCLVLAAEKAEEFLTEEENERGVISVDQLKRQDIIYTNYALNSSNEWMEEFFPIHQNYLVNIHDGTKALQLTLAGLGFCMLPYSLCAPYLENGQLKRISVSDFVLPEYEYFIIRPEGVSKEYEIL